MKSDQEIANDIAGNIDIDSAIYEAVKNYFGSSDHARMNKNIDALIKQSLIDQLTD